MGEAAVGAASQMPLRTGVASRPAAAIVTESDDSGDTEEVRLALVGPVYPHRGGIPRYTEHLYRELAKRHEVRLFAYSRLYPRWLYPGRSDRDPSVAREEVPAERILDQLWPRSWVLTAQAIRAFKPEAVVLQWWTSFGAPATAAISRLVRTGPGPRVLIICHNLYAHERRPLDAVAARIALSAADGLLLQSRQDLQTAERLLPGRPLWQVNHPVWCDLDHLPVPAAQAKASLGLEGPVLLFFGLVREHKGLDLLLRALPLVRQKMRASLLVVGEFWDDRSKYERLAAELGLGLRLRIVDRYVSDEEMALYFCAADVVVLPYRHATQSGVVATAYAFGRPVVATAVGGLVDVVRDGASGVLVEPGSPEALAAGVVRCLRAGAPAAYAEGVAEMQRYLSWQRLAATIEDAAKAVTLAAAAPPR